MKRRDWFVVFANKEKETVMHAQRIALVAVVLGIPLSAHAYVDPGTGMLLWQGLIAAVGAMLVFVRNPMASVRRLIDRLKRK